MEEKKKSPIGVIILVIILMIACLCGGYYLSYSGVVKIGKDNTTKETNKEVSKDKEPEVTVYASTDEKVSKLVDQLIAGFSCDRLEMFTNTKKVVPSDLSADVAYGIALYNNWNDNKTKGTITMDEMNKMIQNVLGKDYKFDVDKLTDQRKACISHYYDSSSKTFVPQETACGGTCGPHTTYEIVKAVDTDGVLKMDVKVIFAALENGKEGFYSDYAKTNRIGSFEEELEYLLKKGSDYQFTFKNEDGNYVFVSSEPLK